ncbi:isochorismatase family cysteine hydrolase [Streptomyces sp. NPDC093589]|uniref:isochorismatase family cysteine hydrolase n=1 Tax=Streptomyces sp. NPDC093589 TaxID=3366043 RepID=UPI00381215B6
MDPRTTALIVVDVQNGFVNDRSRHAVPAVQRLVDSWTKAGAPVVFARFYNAVGSPYERFTGWTRLRSAEEQGIVPELAPYLATAAAVIDKPTSSALTPELLDLVERSGWTDLALCGIDTDSCVYDTAVSAYHAGYRPWLVTDACASTGGNAYHEAALLLAGRNLGRAQLTTTDEVLCRLGASKAAA